MWLDDSAPLSQLLLDDNSVAPGGDAFTSGNDELLDLFDFAMSFPPTTTSSSAAAPQLSRSSLCRRRQREEIQRLRTEVSNLESMYAQLCAERAEKRQRTSHDGHEAERPMREVWKRIARNQERLRRNAECENATLRRLVDEHQKMAQRIKKSMCHRSLEEQTKKMIEKKRDQPLSAAQSATRWKAIAAAPHWQRIFRIVFENESFWMNELEREFIQISTDATGRTIIEGIYSNVYPFDVAKTSRALWRCYNKQFIAHTGGYFSVTSASDNVLAAKAIATVEESGRTLLLRSDVLIHKVSEHEDRAVFVCEDWDAQSEDDGTGMDSKAAVRVSLDICISLEPMQGGGDDGPATLVRIYALSRPCYRGAVLEDPIRAMCDKLVESYYDSNRRFMQLMETYLLDDAFGQGTGMTHIEASV